MPALQEFVWCVVANVRAERRAGPGGGEVWRGTKHFRPGAKVYVWYGLWDELAGRVRIVGQSRGGRWIDIVTRAAWLTNFRVKAVYEPHVIRALTVDGHVPHPMDDTERASVEKRAAALREMSPPDARRGGEGGD